MLVKSSFVFILVSIHKPVQISMNAMRSCKGSHYLAPEHIVADLLTSLSRDRVTGQSQPRLGASLSRDTDTALTSPPLAWLTLLTGHAGAALLCNCQTPLPRNGSTLLLRNRGADPVVILWRLRFIMMQTFCSPWSKLVLVETGKCLLSGWVESALVWPWPRWMCSWSWWQPYCCWWSLASWPPLSCCSSHWPAAGPPWLTLHLLHCTLTHIGQNIAAQAHLDTAGRWSPRIAAHWSTKKSKPCLNRVLTHSYHWTLLFRHINTFLLVDSVAVWDNTAKTLFMLWLITLILLVVNEETSALTIPRALPGQWLTLLLHDNVALLLRSVFTLLLRHHLALLSTVWLAVTLATRVVAHLDQPTWSLTVDSSVGHILGRWKSCC